MPESWGASRLFTLAQRACEFTEQMLPNLERPLDRPDMTEELAEVLSTPTVELKYRVELDVNIRE